MVREQLVRVRVARHRYQRAERVGIRIGQHGDADAGQRAELDRPVQQAVDNPARDGAPVGAPHRVPVDRVHREAVGVAGGLRDGRIDEARRHQPVELAGDEGLVGVDHRLGVVARRRPQAPVERRGRGRGQRRELVLEQREIGEEGVVRALHHRVVQRAQARALGSGILAGAVHLPEPGLLEPVGVRAVGRLVERPLGLLGARGAAPGGDEQHRRCRTGHARGPVSISSTL